MNRTAASARLQTRRRRTHRRAGPASQRFTPLECEAVRVLSSHGKTQESLARDSGLTIKQFRTAMEKDEKLRDAWDMGKAVRREKRISELEAQSRKGNVRATELLLRYEHRDAGPQTQRGAAADVTVNINANMIPPAQDGRSYAALMKRIQKGNAPTLIEHDELERPDDIDPIAAVKLKQQQERERR